MEENNIDNNNGNNHPLSIIDEKPELTTLMLATKMQNDNESLLSNKILSKLSKGYTFYTVIKAISYSINETSFILPYCLRKLGIIPFFLFLLLLPLPSIYIFYLLIDLVVKYNLYDDYHKIIQQNTNKITNLLYYIITLVYHILIIIFENKLYLSLCLRVLSFFDISFGNNYKEQIIILLISLIFFEFPFSFIKKFKKPDLLYIIFTILYIILNIISLVFVIIYKSSDKLKLIEINLYEDISKSYLTCYSIFIIVVGWQSQFSKHLKDFKIKTTKRFYKVIYFFFIIQLFLITFICFVSAPLISDKADLIIFVFDNQNLNITHIIIIDIAALIFGLYIHIIIAHHIQLIQDRLKLILHLTIYKTKPKFEINKYLSVSFNLFILVLTNFICLFFDDLSLIIIIYGGIFSTLINFLFPAILYWFMISKNSLATWLGLLISIIMILFGILALILKILL